MTARACTCNARDCGPGSGHESYCGKPENDEDNAPELSPVAGDPELLADGTIVAWDISSRTRISFVADQIFVTGHFPDPPTERTVTVEQIRRFANLLLDYAAEQQARVTE